MNPKNRIILLAIYLVICSVILALLLFPVYTELFLNYPFYTYNILTFGFSSMAIYAMFFGKYSIFDNSRITLTIIICSVPIFLIVLTDIYFNLIEFNNTEGFQSLTSSLNAQKSKQLSNYIRSVSLFLSITSLIASIVLPIKLIRSIWRKTNS